MGMDLEGMKPSHPDGKTFRAALSGWHWLRRLLTALGCDTSTMPTTNDGEVIRADVLAAWADALDLYLIGASGSSADPDPAYEHGIEDHLRSGDFRRDYMKLPDGRLWGIVVHPDCPDCVSMMFEAPMEQRRFDFDEEAVLQTPAEELLRLIREGDLEFLRSASRFMRHCGGCYVD